MYDITRTRMLLTTAVFAAVAALFAAGGNAGIPADTGSAFAAQESLRIGRYLAQGFVEIRFVGQLAGTQSRAGSTRYGYVVGGELIVPRQSSAQLPSGFDGVADVGVNDDRFTVGVGFP